MSATAKRRTTRIRGLATPTANAFNDAVSELRDKLELETFKEVVQRGTSDATYEFHFTDRPCIIIGNWQQSRSQQHVRGKFEEARIKLPRFSNRTNTKTTTWPKIVDWIFDATRVIETITEEEELRSMILPFLRNENFCAIDFEQEEKQDLIKRVEHRSDKGIFFDIRNGVVYLKAERLVSMINTQRIGRKYSQHEFVKLLQRHGFQWRQKGIRYRDADNNSRFHNFGRFWRSPELYVIRDEERSQQPEEFTRPRRVIAASKRI